MLQRILIFLFALMSLVAPLRAADGPKLYWLHLPGIGGHMVIDDLLTTGLELGGIDAELKIDDWTIPRTGLAALTNLPANQIQAQRIADDLTKIARADPRRKILITSHSAGTGIAIFALEKLPQDVHIQTLVLIASALSPGYDLSKALTHVDGHVYVLSSQLDPVLAWGTEKFGTVDRVYTEAAGRIGFKQPEAADPRQYAKLVPVPYDAAWMALGNAGDHVGAMNRRFAAQLIAPLILTGNLPVLPTTRPSTMSSERPGS